VWESIEKGHIMMIQIIGRFKIVEVGFGFGLILMRIV
jgi:hypothetical protein